jgi:hypothetical protein
MEGYVASLSRFPILTYVIKEQRASIRKLLMRNTLLLLFLSIAIGSFSQNPKFDAAFKANMPEGLGDPIHLPKVEWRSEFDIDKIAPYDAKIRILVVNSDSFYHKIFSSYNQTKESLAHYEGSKDDWQYKTLVSHLSDSLRSIDFNKYELVLYSACAQCLANCHHDKGNPSCHRNVCVFTNAWFLREKVVTDKKETKLFL